MRIAILGLVVFAAAGVRAALPGLPAGTYCPLGHVLRVPPQEGWQSVASGEVMPQLVAFTRNGETDPTLGMFLWPGNSDNAREQPASAASAREALEGLVDFQNALGGGIESETMTLRHPKYPSAAVHQWARGAHFYTVVFDPGGPYATLYRVQLAVRGRPATANDLRALVQLLRTIEVDVAHECDFSSGEVALRPVKAQTPPVPAAREDEAPVATAAFRIERALSGCGMLQRLLQGAYCKPRDVDGRPSIVVRLEGDDPLPKLLDKFSRTIAIPYCREKRERPEGALPLWFETAPKGATLREWDCTTMALAAEPRPGI